MRGTRALVKGRRNIDGREGGSKLRGKGLLIGMLMVAVAMTSFTALGFEAYFSDASGNKITEVWEGRSVHVSVEDPYKVACGIDAFTANVLIFDYKTGAYREIEATFIETGYAKGVFVWDQGAIPVGDRVNWQPVSYEYPYRLADRTLREQLAIGFEHVTDNLTDDDTLSGRWWEDGNWEYVDSGVVAADAGQNTGRAQRYQFEELGRFENQDTLILMVEDELDGFWGAAQLKVKRTEAKIQTSLKEVYYGCSDIIITIEDKDESLSSDKTDFVPFFVIVNPGSWNWTDLPEEVDPPPLHTLTIEVDPVGGDGTTNPAPGSHEFPEGSTVSLEAIDGADFFFEFWDGPVADPNAKTTTLVMPSDDLTITAVFSPPGVAAAENRPAAVSAAVVAQPDTRGTLVNNFCAFMRTGGVDPETGAALNDPIRWYNIYDMRYIRYPYDADARASQPDGWGWAPAPDPHASTDNVPQSLVAPDGMGDIERLAGIARTTFYAQETGPNTGVFRFNFGSLDQLQKRLGFQRFPAGTTIAFYYVDPNDFSDMVVTTIHVASPYTRSKVEITDAVGRKVNEVRLGESSLYFRVEDSKQSMDDCLQESVLVHVCDVHGEDDSEYWNLDEISAAAGVFAAAGAMRLEPVWDAVGGYQLVLDDHRFQAFNADTIFVRYNSVRHNPDHVSQLGAGTGALEDKEHFPPEIITVDPRFVDEVGLPYYPWDVSFDTVKVYDYQVFDGTRTTMRFLDGKFNPVTTYRPGDQIYLEVTDLDQNEDSRVAERITGRWDRPSSIRDSSPIWEFGGGGVLGDFLGGQFATESSAKVFIFNPRTGNVKPVDLMETGPDTGVFKSTTGLKVSDLGGMESDAIVAFYQDPSNHHDIAILSTRVKGGPIIPPEPASVSFDRNQYSRGDTGTITVTEPQFAGQDSITGTDILVLRDKDGVVVKTWNELTRVSGTQNRFRGTFTVPSDIPTGTIRTVYTHPTDPDRTAQATAQVLEAVLEDVTGIDVSPAVLVNTVTFSLISEPAGAVADRIGITIYDLTGRQVAEMSGTNTASLSWDGGSLRNSAYVYVAVVEGPNNRVWTFRGFVYIKR